MNSGDGTLILAWGNPGRLDDGLGPALARSLAEMALPQVTILSNYQLQVEDAEDVARHRRVVFADADRTGPGPFHVERLQPAERSISFSTHSVTPAAVLALARDLFGARPEGWLVGIRGYRFDEFGEQLSDPARANLHAAASHLRRALEADEFHAFHPPEDTRREPRHADTGRERRDADTRHERRHGER